MTPTTDASVTIGAATTIAVDYLLQAFLALAFGWAGWQFRQMRLEMGRLRENVSQATQELALFGQWREMHDQRDQERHQELGDRIAEVWGVVNRLPRTTVRGNGT